MRLCVCVSVHLCLDIIILLYSNLHFLQNLSWKEEPYIKLCTDQHKKIVQEQQWRVSHHCCYLYSIKSL